MPWVDIKELPHRVQIGLEDQLSKELHSEHKLFNKKLQAIAKREDCDDVLFVDLDSEQVFVVHLTWGQGTEQGPFPITQAFKNFESFVVQRMQPDHFEFNL